MSLKNNKEGVLTIHFYMKHNDANGRKSRKKNVDLIFGFALFFLMRNWLEDVKYRLIHDLI